MVGNGLNIEPQVPNIMPDSRYCAMLMMRRDAMRQQNANIGVETANAEYNTGQPPQTMTPLLVPPRHGQSISSVKTSHNLDLP